MSDYKLIPPITFNDYNPCGVGVFNDHVYLVLHHRSNEPIYAIKKYPYTHYSQLFPLAYSIINLMKELQIVIQDPNFSEDNYKQIYDYKSLKKEVGITDFAIDTEYVHDQTPLYRIYFYAYLIPKMVDQSITVISNGAIGIYNYEADYNKVSALNSVIKPLMYMLWY